MRRRCRTAWWWRRAWWSTSPWSLGITTCLLPLHHLLLGSFQQEEVKQPHCRDAKRRTSLSSTALCTCHNHTPVENPLVEETASLDTRSLTTCRPALVVGPVQPLWKKTYQESLAWRGRRRARGRFWPALGRGPTSSNTSIENVLWFF